MFFIALTILLLLRLSHAEDQPTVKTAFSTIYGLTRDVNVFGTTKQVHQYLGIPYAEAPVGHLRFRKTSLKQTLDSPFYATRHGKACFQLGIFPLIEIERSEDCLFLNVYVPAGNNDGLAVMVFIHGGSFSHGASDAYVADTLAVNGDVIVVTFNYRLSIFGFLTTEDGNARGNYALSDQHLAIKWVHEHIEGFGGDPNKVTLFGQSVGGASVIIQSLYKGNDGLFQRGIAMSATTLPRPFDFKFANPKDNVQRLGKLVGCYSRDSATLVQCLRNVPAEVLFSTLNNVSNGFYDFPLPFFLNTLDGEFLKRSDFLADIPSVVERFGSREYIVGFTSNEGCFMVMPAAGVLDAENFKPNQSFYETQLIPRALELSFGALKVPQLIKKLVLQVYTDWTDPYAMEKIRQQFVNIWSDVLFTDKIIETAKRHEHMAKDSAAMYLYEFAVNTTIHPLPCPSWCSKGAHGDELPYVFFEESGGLLSFIPGYQNYTPSAIDRDVAKMMMTMWTNFAKSGLDTLFLFSFHL